MVAEEPTEADDPDQPTGRDGCQCPICTGSDPSAPPRVKSYDYKGHRIEIQQAPTHGLTIDGIDVMPAYQANTGKWWAHGLIFLGFPSLEALAQHVVDANVPIDAPLVRMHRESMSKMESMPNMQQAQQSGGDLQTQSGGGMTEGQDMAEQDEGEDFGN